MNMNTITNIHSLLDTLITVRDEAARIEQSPDDIVRMDLLPTFGGDEPSNTLGVWSWDPECVLVGDGWDDLQLMSRAEFGGK